jgi:hypothetical protein
MAPTVFRTRNYRIVIYPKDHRPAHVHIIGPDAEAKFDINTLECISSHGFSQKALKTIQEFLESRQKRLLEIWDEYQE